MKAYIVSKNTKYSFLLKRSWMKHVSLLKDYKNDDYWILN